MKVSQSEPAPPPTTHSNTAKSHGFPYFQYISVLGILTTLLGFSGIYLPRSTTYFATLPPPQSSLDKPQHPLLVPITASPVSTLLWLCLGVATCQAWFGGWVRSWWSHYPRLGFQPSKTNDIETLISQSKSSQVFSTAVMNTIAGSLLIHALAVGFGAPIFSYFLQTYSLALLIALLVVFVPSYALSLPSFSKANDDSKLSWITAMRLFGQRRLTTPLERSIVYPCYFVFFGSWLGTIPIALDWDRPWQAWPLTPAYGALIGYILGLWIVLGANIFLRLVEEGTQRKDK